MVEGLSAQGVRLTALIACLIAYFYHRKHIQPAAWLALLLTAAVNERISPPGPEADLGVGRRSP